MWWVDQSCGTPMWDGLTSTCAHILGTKANTHKTITTQLTLGLTATSRDLIPAIVALFQPRRVTEFGKELLPVCIKSARHRSQIHRKVMGPHVVERTSDELTSALEGGMEQ